MSSGDDHLQVSGDTTTSVSSISADDIRDSLPLGWSPTPKPNEGRTALILALSLVLALFICFFIIGCVFWRKTLKRHKRDLEAELKKWQSVPSAAEVAKNKESKAKHQLLVRATARWKANVRHAARQRKGKRVAASKSPQVHQFSNPPNNSRSRLALSLSLPPSRASSRRSSIVVLPDDLPQPVIGELLSHDAISTVDTSPHSNVPTSPPAYHHGTQVSPTTYSSISHATPPNRPLSEPSSFRVGIDSHSSGISTPKPFHAAHVATDDKALLSRLADLASRPPEDTSAHTSDACDAHVSAPAWHDELEEIPPDLITSNDHPPDLACSPSSFFPAPPSKECMAAADLYEYSFSLEDMAALDPELEPSAPPFQLGSAPPLDDHQIIIPSAPPLTDDAELVDVHPNAPRSASYQFDVVDQENLSGQDHDRIMPTSGNAQPLSASRQGTGDDIALPGYRP